MNQTLRRGTVLYESLSGNGMLCNPEALFSRLLELPEFAALTHIWVLADIESRAAVIDRYRRRSNIKSVEYQSAAYFADLASSEYLVKNATFPWQFVKRNGQKHINTWHRTPQKTMGYDVDGRGPDTHNIVWNFPGPAEGPPGRPPRGRDLPGIDDYLVPNGIPTNVMLSLTDVQVTDYSSIYVDFQAKGRPVYFFAPDSDCYERDRGR